MKTHLDFLIIGAQKAGTTTLFKLLAEKQNIYMPAEKEAPFFSLDDRYDQGWDWFIREFFSTAPEDRLWGKASPQYMSDPRVPERLSQQLPQVRLIAILRNPIERAFSHYRMIVKRGLEIRGFSEAISQSLDASNLQQARLLPAHPSSEMHCYLAWGEYGRILQRYLEFYSISQILILFTEDLERDPQAVLDKTMRFLGLDTGFTPANLGKRYHQGGSKQRVPWLRDVVKKTPLNQLWMLLPASQRRNVAYWFKQFNTVPDEAEQVTMDFQVRQDLIAFFQSDVKLLEDSFKLSVPWQELRQGVYV